MNFEYKQNQVLTIDLHGYEVSEARRYLNTLLYTINVDIKEVIIIHGYHNGKALMNFIRSEYKNDLIERKLLFFNQGRTSLIIKH